MDDQHPRTLHIDTIQISKSPIDSFRPKKLHPFRTPNLFYRQPVSRLLRTALQYRYHPIHWPSGQNDPRLRNQHDANCRNLSSLHSFQHRQAKTYECHSERHRDRRSGRSFYREHFFSYLRVPPLFWGP